MVFIVPSGTAQQVIINIRDMHGTVSVDGKPYSLVINPLTAQCRSIMNFRYHLRNGFALVEVMIALSMVAIILTALMMVEGRVLKDLFLLVKNGTTRFYKNMFLMIKKIH